MDQPTLIDYAHLIIALFYQFVQTNPVVLRYQNLCTYKYRGIIILLMIRWPKNVPGSNDL
jgi:hypothetical protein